MEKQNILETRASLAIPNKPRKIKVYMIVLSIMLVSVLFLAIKAYGYNENLYWRGGAGNISNTAHWFSNNGNTNCVCVPKATLESTNTVYFDSNSGSGNVTLDINISSGPIHINNNANIKIIILNNTKWTVYNIGPALVPPINPPFNVGQTLAGAFYIIMFVTGSVLFIMFAFWVRRKRGMVQ